MYPGCETEVLQFALLSGLGWENPSELVSHPCPDGDSGNGLVCPESVSSVFTSTENKVAHDFWDKFGLPELSSDFSCVGNILEDVIHDGENWVGKLPEAAAEADPAGDLLQDNKMPVDVPQGAGQIFVLDPPGWWN